jgi:ubiquinone/menaquinone biosynthesis C-methylase UbiE
MKDPHLTRFIQLLEQGAAARDIHDSMGLGSYDSESSGRVSERFVQRELDRVEVHRRGLCTTLEAKIGVARRVLDVGCGTGGTTVALAMSGLQAEYVVGVDADVSTVEAARVRAASHGFGPDRVHFEEVAPGGALPFPDASFDLVTCVSVMEFISTEQSRIRFVTELLRVVRPSGHVFLATPSPFRLREYHSKRWLGDWRRTPGYPWSSPPWATPLHALRAGNEPVPLARMRLQRDRRLRMVVWAAFFVQWLLPWQQYLVRRSA